MSDKNDVAPDEVEDFKLRTSEYSKSTVNPDIFKLRKEVSHLKISKIEVADEDQPSDSRSKKATGVFVTINTKSTSEVEKIPEQQIAATRKDEV